MGAANTTAHRTIRHATHGPAGAVTASAARDGAASGRAEHPDAPGRPGAPGSPGAPEPPDRPAAPGRAGPDTISPQDLELLRMLADGALLGAVARRLQTSERTVRRRIRNICDLLGVDAPIQAVVWAARRGLL
jgi:DNA-binding NarL/FixJ family response regulator